MHYQEYYTNLTADDVGKYVLVLRDPQRAEKIASFFDDHKFVNSSREYTAYTGSLDGEKITAMSTGVGGPSLAIAIEELHKLGATTIIRVGSCSSIQPNIKNGSLVIPCGVFRGAGTTHSYVPAEYPAVPHPGVLTALCKSAAAMPNPLYVGITHSRDVFYREPAKMPDTESARKLWKMLLKTNVLASEMETDTLFVLSSIRGLRAGAVFSALGPIDDTDVLMMGIEAATKVAMAAMRIIIESDRSASI